MMGGDFIMSSGAIAASTEPWKSTVIKGMLGKNDLAEAYNCEVKRKGKYRRKSVDEGTENRLKYGPVKSVEFREAFLEDVLVAKKEENSDAESKGNSISERRFRDAIRVLSQPNFQEQNNNSDYSSLERDSKAYKNRYTRRKISSDNKPPVLRRRSALDLPAIQPEVSGDAVDSGYEPENALNRVRKKSGGNLAQKGARRRRSGLETVQAQNAPAHDGGIVRRVSSPAFVSSLNSSRVSLDSTSSSEGSPPSRRSAAKKAPLFELSIPEHSEIDSDASSSSTSPPQFRKAKGTLQRIASEISFSPSILRKAAAAVTGISSRQLSYPPTGRQISPSQSLSSFSDISTASSRVATSHKNSTRYWEWYVTSASYSWQNFNTDKHLCY